MTISILNQPAHQSATTAQDWKTVIPEIDTMAVSLASKHGAEVMGVAALVRLSQSLLRHFGAAHGSSVEPLLALQWDCVRAWANERDIPLGTLKDAVAGIERAGQTAHYLSQIPT